MGRFRATDTVDRIVKSFASSLKSRGYKKRGRTFTKATDDGGVVIHVQLASDNNDEMSRFTVNLAVRQDRLQGLMDWPMKGGSLVLGDCIIRERIGKLMKVKRDFWWIVEPQMSVEGVASDALAAVETCGVPFLDGLESWENSRAYILETQGDFRAFCVYVLEGEYGAAREAFLRLTGPNSEIMKNRARKCAKKVGLLLPDDVKGSV